jgi:hypothetical protein
VIAKNDSGRCISGEKGKTTMKLKFIWLVSGLRFRPEHKAETLTSTLAGETFVLMINREYEY